MNEMYIISFNSTHQAIKCDKIFGKNEIDYTVLPTPREITQSCGISIKFSIENIDNIKETTLIMSNGETYPIGRENVTRVKQQWLCKKLL